MKWEFKEVGKNDLEQRPHRQEFFRDTPRPEAFVREVIQNSLDAKSNDSDKVKVRFVFDEVSLSDFKRYIEGLEPHLDAWDIKPKDWKEKKNPNIPVLIIEDSGTVGLTGPVSRDPNSSHKNDHFLNFWLREGMSGKKGTKGGRWGLGKNTFFMTTKINTFWGLTCRGDGKELLMGKSALMPHTIDGKRYRYYGFFRNNNSNPISDKNTIQHFKKSTPVKRRSSNGLSLVIPYPVSDINYESVTRSVIMHYFYPILRGNLLVKVEDNGNSSLLNRNNISKVANRIDWEGSNWEDKDVNEMLNFVLRGVQNIEKNTVIQLSDDLGEEKKIKKDLISDKLEEIIKKFNKGEIVTISVPVTIQKTNSSNKLLGDFFVFLKQYPPTEFSSSDEFYIRSGIRLPEESRRYHRLGKRPVRGMLVIEDDYISSFLADAEVPAHTHWNEQTEGFSEKYEDSRETIRYIRNSMRDIAGLLFKTTEERYEGLLQDFFSVVGGAGITPERPTRDDREDKPVSDEQRDEDDLDEGEDEEEEKEPEVKTSPKTPEIDIPPSTRQLLNIVSIDKGFKISYIGEDEHLPIEKTVIAAYDVHRGNPFNKYEPFDFVFDDLQIKGKGFDILDKNDNELTFNAYSGDFVMEVTGFDETRDLVVRL